MSDPIVPDPRITRNCENDLICPRCHAQCRLARRRLTCPACGWRITLTKEQAAEIRAALAGVTDLPLPAYLLVLATAPPPSPSGGVWRWGVRPLAALGGA